MKIRTFLSINAILLGLFGLGFLIIPARMFGLYGATTNQLGLLAARAFAVVTLQVAVIIWVVRDDANTRIFRVLIPVLLVGYSISFFLALQGQIVGTLNDIGWLNVALYLLLASGCVYYQFSKPSQGTHAGDSI